MAAIVPGHLPTSSAWDMNGRHHRRGVTGHEYCICVRHRDGRRIAIHPASGNDQRRLVFLSPIGAFSPKDQFCGIAAVFICVPNTICSKLGPERISSVPKHVMRWMDRIIRRLRSEGWTGRKGGEAFCLCRLNGQQQRSSETENETGHCKLLLSLHVPLYFS